MKTQCFIERGDEIAIEGPEAPTDPLDGNRAHLLRLSPTPTTMTYDTAIALSELDSSSRRARTSR